MLRTVFRIHDILVWIRIRGSIPLPNGFGSGSCYFRHRTSRCQQKTNFLFYFSAYYFLKIHLYLFSKIKSPKESQNSRNQGFSYYFAWSGSGSIPLTNGSGSGSRRPKNMWLRWIRIRNTGCGSGIQDPVPFWPWDPDPGWTTRIMFPRAKKQFFGLKYLNSLMRIRDGKSSDLG